MADELDLRAEFVLLNAKIAAHTATPEERRRWRDLRQSSGLPTGASADQVQRSRRRAIRHLPLGFEKVDQLSTAMTEDLSASGLSIRSDRAVTVGTNLLLHLEINGAADPVSTLGQVVWSKADGDGYRLGIEFTSLTPEQAERIEAMLLIEP